ncbi:MAG: PucR family transcriptional regulator [Candidatus Limnocylindria bacterium]
MDSRPEWPTGPENGPAGTYALAFLGAAGAAARALQGSVQAALPSDARVVAVRGPTVIALHRLADGIDPRAAADAVRVRVAALLADPTLSVGLGGPRDRERPLRLVALHAEQAVRLGRALNGHGRVTAFGDLGPYCFVLGRPTEEIRAFCRGVLGPLAERAQRDELRTLEEFLRAHGNVSSVARALFLHRNTVRQRLKRIGELTGADLEDVDQRTALYLAVLGQTALEQLAS